jgi:hypothetical protein
MTIMQKRRYSRKTAQDTMKFFVRMLLTAAVFAGAPAASGLPRH